MSLLVHTFGIIIDVAIWSLCYRKYLVYGLNSVDKQYLISCMMELCVPKKNTKIIYHSKVLNYSWVCKFILRVNHIIVWPQTPFEFRQCKKIWITYLFTKIEQHNVPSIYQGRCWLWKHVNHFLYRNVSQDPI